MRDEKDRPMIRNYRPEHTEEALVSYHGILSMWHYMRNKNLDRYEIRQDVYTKITTILRPVCDYFSCKIDPTVTADDIPEKEHLTEVQIVARVLITESGIQNGFDHLAYNIEDFSEEELQAINDACELEAAKLKPTSN